MTVFQSMEAGRGERTGAGEGEQKKRGERRDSGGRERMDRDQGARTGDGKSMDGLGSIRRSPASKICLVMGSLCWWLILWWSLPVSDGSDGVAGGTALDRWPAKQKRYGQDPANPRNYRTAPSGVLCAASTAVDLYT